MSAYVAPVIAAPTMGPTMNNQIWATHVCLPPALTNRTLNPRVRGRWTTAPAATLILWTLWGDLR